MTQPKRTLLCAMAVTAALVPSAGNAGPPFRTDDPEPTETGHWEIYAPLLEAEGSGKDFEGAAGAEINYGPMKDVQLTVSVPVTTKAVINPFLFRYPQRRTFLPGRLDALGPL
jgi:hypothetical protein